MAEDAKDVPKTHEALEQIAETEAEAGVVDQQAAAEKRTPPTDERPSR